MTPLKEPLGGEVPDDALRAVGEVDRVRGEPEQDSEAVAGGDGRRHRWWHRAGQAARHGPARAAMLRQSGFGQAEALRAIASDAPVVCRLGHRKGRIAPGFDAGVLAADGDPIADPDALHHIHVVYARGTVEPSAGT